MTQAIHQGWEATSEAFSTLAPLLGLEPSNAHWTFYYDETGNYRTISYKDDVIPDERSLTGDFILGGLAFKSAEAEQRAIKRALELPSPQGEIKARSILGGSRDLVRVLSRRETTKFLRILEDNDVLVHYGSQNNLYFATVDIVDSLLVLDELRSFQPFERELKNALFTCIGAEPKRFLDFVRGYGYPNVVAGDIGPFCRYLEGYVRSCLGAFGWYRASLMGDVSELLCEMLAVGSSSGELAFLSGNQEGELVRDYVHFYRHGCLMFPKSFHTYDTEPSVEGKIGSMGRNYEFVDSKGNVLVQLSDVYVGLLARLFSFFDSLHPGKLSEQRSRFRGQARDNLRTVRDSLVRSGEANAALIYSVNARTELILRDYYLDELCG